MVENIVRVARALPPTYGFECFIFAYTDVAITMPSPYACTVVRARGFWTDYMKMVRSNSTYVAIMMDDVSPAEVRMPAFLRTMQQYDLEVAAPVQPSWHWKVMMRDAERKCVVRVTKYIDMLFTVFSHRAWECWRRQIDTDKNSMGWGMDATFHFTCGMKMGLLDEHTAVHEDLTSGTEHKFVEAKETRTYNETLAHLELAEWLADKAIQFNVTYGWDVDSGCARRCASSGKPSVKKQYMKFLMGIANGPTECIPAGGGS
ncbi:unnamed protein product [Prorocentrum cordatum]|nr:unnamed protein product [Polarella glacialis]